MEPLLQVLYAEDDPHDADLTRVHFELEAPGLQLDVVETGAKCLELAHSGAYDVLLLDNHLPDMDGLDVLRALLRENRWLPVVMVTGVGDEDLVIRALRLGACDYVPKKSGYLQGLPAVLKAVVAEARTKRRLWTSMVPDRRRILYVEHIAMDVDLTREHAASAAPHLDLEPARTCQEALDLLEQGREYDLVLIDLRMPDVSALEFIRAVRRRGIAVPFIVLTGRGDEDAAVAALKLGASDYIVKRENYLTHLTYSIDNAIYAFRVEQAVTRLHGELEALNRSLERKVAERTAELEREVAERRQAEAALREISARMQQMQDEERRRIARELHDSTAQNLVALRICISRSLDAPAGLAPAALRALRESLDLADQCQREIRTLSYLLHPPLLDELGLASALRDFVDGYSRRTEVPVELHLPEEMDRLAAPAELALFRVAQEALSNIHRHSGSPTAELRLLRGPAEIVLEVRDHGRGVPGNIVESMARGGTGLGVGLAGMRERMRQLGGSLVIRLASPGTLVRAALPL
ncbi:MAG: response regulator [Acidobacteria bacterium]|nr:response regulator [Acidobacteriota bacterium]